MKWYHHYNCNQCSCPCDDEYVDNASWVQCIHIVHHNYSKEWSNVEDSGQEQSKQATEKENVIILMQNIQTSERMKHIIIVIKCIEHDCINMA